MFDEMVGCVGVDGRTDFFYYSHVQGRAISTTVFSTEVEKLVLEFSE